MSKYKSLEHGHCKWRPWFQCLTHTTQQNILVICDLLVVPSYYWKRNDHNCISSMCTCIAGKPNQYTDQTSVSGLIFSIITRTLWLLPSQTSGTAVACHVTVWERGIACEAQQKCDHSSPLRANVAPLMWKLRNSLVCFLMMKSKHMCRADLTLARLSDEMCGQKLQLCFCISQITFSPNTSKCVRTPETCNISINSRPVCWHGFGQTLESRPGIADSPALCWPCSFSSVPRARRVAFLFSYLRQSNSSFPG